MRPSPGDHLATVVYDSSLDDTLASATRSSTPALLLVLRSADLAVELGCVGSTVVGQVVPPGPAEVDLFRRDRRAPKRAISDPAGGFVFDLVPGPFRLQARALSGGTLATDWLSAAG